jgi:hypothetical protein
MNQAIKLLTDDVVEEGRFHEVLEELAIERTKETGEVIDDEEERLFDTFMYTVAEMAQRFLEYKVLNRVKRDHMNPN